MITIREFLVDSSHTGRHIVKSFRTGKVYFVEAVGDPHIEWGSLDQASGKLTVKKGWCKYKGSIDEKDSLITKENGFKKIHDIGRQNPLSYIEELDRKYPTIAR